MLLTNSLEDQVGLEPTMYNSRLKADADRRYGDWSKEWSGRRDSNPHDVLLPKETTYQLVHTLMSRPARYIAVPQGTPARMRIELNQLETRTPLHPGSAPFGELPQVLVRPGRIELPIRPYQGLVIPFNYGRKVDEQGGVLGD